MQRVKITLSYDGGFFNGFQIQKDENKHSISVAGALTHALKTLNIETKIIGSGRTDAGVHALAQVVHCEVPPFWNDLHELKRHLNHILRPHMWIKQIAWVNEDFHARFGAKKRLYRYLLYDGAYQPFLAQYALHVKPLDVTLLNATAQLFSGTHNFGFFKKTKGGTTREERTIFKAGAYRYHGYIVIYFLGDAFLRSQVRMMSDMLLKVCEGKYSVEELIAQRDKIHRISTTLCPACGLYLSRIYY